MPGYNNPVIQFYTSDPTIPGSNPTGYVITEHNRQPLNISYERLEQSSRMADGTMRRFVTANKKDISISWDDLPAAAGYPFTSDANLGGAFLKSFYEENVFNPIWIKLTYAEENWRFAGSSSSTSNNSSNLTFNTTIANSSVPVQNSFNVASVAFTAFTNGTASATLTTNVPHTFSSSATIPEIYLSGINQIFNGAWRVHSVPSSSTIIFRFGTDSNSSATFKINSYVQDGNTASFNVDNTEFIKNSASLVLKNTKYSSGSSINGTWVVTATPTSTTVFTASSSTSSQSGAGQYGEAVILSSPSYVAELSKYSSIVGPAISTDIIKVFIDDFSYEIKKRYSLTDIVNVTIKFKEI